VWITGDSAPNLLWEGELVIDDPAVVVRDGDGRFELSDEPGAPSDGPAVAHELNPRDLPLAGIGQPRVQTLSEFFGGMDLPPALRTAVERADIYVIEFYCSLRPRKVGAVHWARFMVRWPEEGPQIRTLDIHPRDAVKEVQRDLKVSISPSIEFGVASGSVGSVDAGIVYTELQPVVSGMGVGEGVLVWDYRPAKGLPIVGGKYMHAVVEAPLGTGSGAAQLDLAVDVGGIRSFLARNKDNPGITVELWS
jgi:hypothetical protein